MYDQSFCKKTLESVLQKHDFRGIAATDQKAFREDQIAKAANSVATEFGAPSNPLKSFQLKGKTVYGISKLADELVARKLSENLRRAVKTTSKGRTQIVAGLHLLLEEGVPYRVYRLDVKSFYESFDHTSILLTVNNLPRLSPHSKSLLASILKNHAGIGGHGVPRGLSLSAVLADLMMREFDADILRAGDVYYYSRYVDDIIIVTSGRENKKSFTRWVAKKLPVGLKLNPEKRDISEAPQRVTPLKTAAAPTQLFRFDYLGYAFSTHEPDFDPKIKQPGAHSRKVVVDIAAGKVKKFKTRIVRSFADYLKNHDWQLLLDRMKFLTQNFSVYNVKAGGKKLAGVFHSYPQISDDAKGFKDLDLFLRNAVLSKTGRLFEKSALILTAQQRRSLLSQSFERGHREKTFVHFSAVRISEIQKCWLY